MNVKLLKIILGIGLVMTGLVFGVYSYINNKKEKLESEINLSIEKIFQGKNRIMDGEFYSTEVKLNKTPSSIIDLKGYEKTVMPEYEGIKSYYTLINGGFNFIVLEKKNSIIYRLYNITAGDLAYKVKKYDEWGIERQSINNCYKRTFNYFIDVNPEYKNSFVSGSQSEINSFINLENDYYQVKYASFETGAAGDFSSGGNPCIICSDFNLFYSTHGKEYLVMPKSDALIWDYVKYISIGIVIIFILTFIFLYKPKEIKKVENQ